MKGRFAPSPSGRMHLGNVYAALMSWLSVRKQNGEWLLRIEDLDPQRCKLEYALQLEDDLRWLGLDWDEGGTEAIGDDGSSYMQSKRGDIYQHYLETLKDKGVTYPCYCTRADILATQAPHESDGRVVYKGTCRPEEGKVIEDRGAHAIRIMVPSEIISFHDMLYGEQAANLAEQCGDFILRRKDGAWAYQLAVVVDDALMGVTEVVRGRDLLLSANQQIFLNRVFGFNIPTYGHIPLLTNGDGQRLSKRDKSMDMGVLRQNHTPEEIIGWIAHVAGLIPTPSPISARELISEFDWAKLSQDDIVTVNN